MMRQRAWQKVLCGRYIHMNAPARAKEARPESVSSFVPSSPSYYSGKEDHYDRLVHLQSVLRRYETLPTSRTPLTLVRWKSIQDYRTSGGPSTARIKSGAYRKVLNILARLARITPELRPMEVSELIKAYSRQTGGTMNVPKKKTLDVYGRAPGRGKRKTAVARAWVVPGDGQIMINGMRLGEYFAREYDRATVLYPCQIVEVLNQVNVWCEVHGGGPTGNIGMGD